MVKERILSREVIATQIPSGDKQPLPAGTRLVIHQTLGGNYTVQTDFGLFRLDGKDADAIGEKTAASAPAEASAKASATAGRKGGPARSRRPSGRSCARFSTRRFPSISWISGWFTRWTSSSSPKTAVTASTSP